MKECIYTNKAYIARKKDKEKEKSDILHMQKTKEGHIRWIEYNKKIKKV